MLKKYSWKNKVVELYDGVKLNLGIKRFFKYVVGVLSKVYQICHHYFFHYPKYKIEKYVCKKISPDFKVLKGPFKDLLYPYFPRPTQHFSTVLPKISGVYEKELFPIIKQINMQKYKVFINIGSDEGYYAVGFGKLNRRAKVFAIDINQEALAFSVEMAKKNNVRNYFSVESSSPFALDKLIGDGTCIICDCEGYEKTLLNPKKISGLISTDILVEVHGQRIGKILQKRFNASHNIKKISQADKKVYEIPSKYPFFSYKHIADEMRSEECFWLFLTKK
jgi:hypothetical protein